MSTFFCAASFFASCSKRGGVVAIIFSLLLGSLLPIQTTQAASSDYVASLISLNVPSRLSPNQVGQVQVSFKNIGTATWYQSGKNFTSLYRWDPQRKVEIPSHFYSPAWDARERAGRLPIPSVAPGKEVSLTFPIKAPSQPGIYREEFILTAEGAAWIKYGTFVLEVKVGEGVTVAMVSPSAPSVTSGGTSVLSTGSSEWQAELVERGGSEWQLDADQLVTVELGFKNTGTKTWKREGAGYVSFYATQGGNKERNSAFYDTRWISRSHVVILREAEVLPGQVGHFRFDIRAPMTPGMFQEEFSLAAENTAWLKGGSVTLPIRVPLTGAFIATGIPGSDLVTVPTPVPSAPAPINPAYVASLMLRSVQTLIATGDARQQITFGFKNTGTNPWSTRSMRMKQVTPVLSAGESSIRDASWNDPVEAIRLVGTVKPGEVAFVSFAMKAPARKGEYKAVFQLHADDQVVSGGEIEIPITVTADGAVEYRPVNPPANSTPSIPSTPSTPAINAPLIEAIPLTGDPSTLSAESLIRVGLYKPTNDRVTVRAVNSPLNVLQNGSSICRLNTGDSTTLSYDRTNQVYKVEGGPCTSQSSSFYLVKAEDGVSPIELTSYERSDDTFRSQVELRFTPRTNSVWVINELPVEWYLKGIAETSNISPPQFQRVLLVAARTYAMYHVNRGGTKHADEFYTVDATYDQVYRGYGAESRNPNVVAAVNATRGQIVTYQGRLAITPYYSRSDGRTRSWGEVWYGGSQYPWLVSVPVPWDNGQTLLGHGVGMSARGALLMANDGRTYDDILKYFYPGTELRRAYR